MRDGPHVAAIAPFSPHFFLRPPSVCARVRARSKMGNAAAKGLPFAQGAAVGGYRFRSPFAVFEGAGTGQSAGPPTGAPATSAAVDRVLLFRFDKRSPSVRPGDLELAQNALRRLRMLRHPYVLKYIVSMKSDRC